MVYSRNRNVVTAKYKIFPLRGDLDVKYVQEDQVNIENTFEHITTLV